MPAAGRWLQLTGCILSATVMLSGCGGGGADATTAATVTSHPVTTVAKTSDSKKRNERQAPPAAGPCQVQLGSFVASMDSLRRRLAVGLTYDQYVAEVRGIGSTYRKIPIDRVEIDCLTAAGTAAEKAFNRYIEAANDWGGCVAEAGCSSATVEPALQRHWRIASRFLSAADAGLNAGAP